MNEKTIECLAGARFCGQLIPRYERFIPTQVVYRGAQGLLQFSVERTLGREVEISPHEVRDLAIFRRLDASDQLVDLRLADGGRTALLKMYVPDVQYRPIKQADGGFEDPLAHYSVWKRRL